MTDELHLRIILNAFENNPNRCKQQQNSCSMKGTEYTQTCAISNVFLKKKKKKVFMSTVAQRKRELTL